MQSAAKIDEVSFRRRGERRYWQIGWLVGGLKMEESRQVWDREKERTRTNERMGGGAGRMGRMMGWNELPCALVWSAGGAVGCGTTEPLWLLTGS